MGTWSDSDLEAIRRLASRWAVQGVPVNEILATIQTAARSLNEAAGRECDDSAAMWRLHEWTANQIPVLLEVAAKSYHASIGNTMSQARGSQLAESLVSGGPSEALAAAGGLHLSDVYLILALRVDDRQAGSYAALEEAVEAGLRQRPTVLACRRGRGYLVLMPVEQGGRSMSKWSTLIEEIRREFGRTGLVIGSAGPAGRAELPGAVAEATAVADLAWAADLPPQRVTKDDLLLERLLAGEDGVATRLAALVEPLDERPELLLTLQTFYRNDLDRTATSADLNIHRRTLTYRLSRISDLTGLAPTSSRGIEVLSAALAAYRMRRFHAVSPTVPGMSGIGVQAS